jgi:hypothetical protein
MIMPTDARIIAKGVRDAGAADVGQTPPRGVALPDVVTQVVQIANASGARRPCDLVC